MHYSSVLIDFNRGLKVANDSQYTLLKPCTYPINCATKTAVNTALT